MDETVLHVELTQGDVAALLNAADRIYSFIGYAQGAEARYQMRREQIVVTLPFAKKKPWRKRNKERKQNKIYPIKHQVNFKRRFARCHKNYRKKSKRPSSESRGITIGSMRSAPRSTGS